MASSVEESDDELKCSVLGAPQPNTANRRASRSSMAEVSLGGLLPLLDDDYDSEEEATPATTGTASSSTSGMQDLLSEDHNDVGINELEAEVRRRRARNVQGRINDLEATSEEDSDPSESKTPEWLEMNNTDVAANQNKVLIEQQQEKNNKSTKKSNFRKRLKKWQIDDHEAEGGKINFWPFASFGVFGRPPKTLDEDPNSKDPPSKPLLRRARIATIGVAIFVSVTLAVSTHLVVQSDLFYDRLPDENVEKDFCIQNGFFRSDPPNMEHWYAIGSQLELKQKDLASSDSVLLATGRTEPPQQVSGMYQNVPANCFTPSKWYTVHARVLMRDAYTSELFYCDPTIMWGNHEKSCPTVNLRMLGGPAQEIAWTVGHNLDENGDDTSNEEGWMNIEGAFFYPSSDAMKGTAQVDIVSITRAPLGVDILLDNLSILPMDENEQNSSGRTNCDANIIANGDAEAGDHRFWFIRGTGSDTNESIQISSSRQKQFGFGYLALLGLGRSSNEDEENKGEFAFKHVGYRNERWRGMIQRINADCLTEGSVWSITASFRYFATDMEGNESPASCNLDKSLTKGSCPVFDIEFITPTRGNPTFITTGPMKNEITDDLSVRTTTSPGEWNEIVHTLVVSWEMAQHTDAYIFINSVDAGFNYELDDIAMVRKLS